MTAMTLLTLSAMLAAGALTLHRYALALAAGGTADDSALLADVLAWLARGVVALAVAVEVRHAAALLLAFGAMVIAATSVVGKTRLHPNPARATECENARQAPPEFPYGIPWPRVTQPPGQGVRQSTEQPVDNRPQSPGMYARIR